ncbi:MAG: EAL domain-containing protein [Pseudomonadota bacterium]
MAAVHPDELLLALSDASEIGLVLIGEDGRIALWNAWIAKASGIDTARALGSRLAEMFPEIAGTRIESAVDQALSTGMSAVLSSSLNKKLFKLTHEGRTPAHNEPMHQIVVIKPVAGRDKSARSCLVQVFDVTPMAHREALLRQQARTMEALAENYRLSELHNRAIVDNTADAIITFGEDGAIGTYNPAAERIFGYDPYEIVGKSIAVLIPELAAKDGRLRIAEFLDERHEVTGLRKIRATFPLELSVSAMELGGQQLYVAIAHDITERKAAEAELRTQKEWLATLINAMPDMVCFKDGKGRWLVANQLLLDLAGLEGVDYQGRTGFELARLARGAVEVLSSTADAEERAWRENRAITTETQFATQGGAKVFDLSQIPLFNDDGSRRGLVVVGRDITERKLAAQRIHHLAHHDSLTGLPNRILFQERLRGALAQAKRAGHKVALMFLDLDKFKDINDTLGHHVGDLLLKAVAKRLQRCVRETDTVARLGGDEFAVVLTNLADPDGASNVAETIIASIADPFGLDEHEVSTSTSIGITVYPDDADDADALLKNADLAMFRSKAEGRNTYHFYVAEMDAEMQARKVIERDLRLALGTDQLELHYQPLVDMSSGAITGCEALLRWKHPTRGWISPAEFIPVAERTDLIGPLGRWIMHQACVQGRDWARQGLPPLKIAVNLSPAQFKNHQALIAMVSDILDQTGFDPALLQLEITEGIAMQNIETTIEVLRTLRSMGALISIDDFGTGYSSLNYLKRFPVDKLKIDRSFVVDIGLHPDNAAVVKAIVNLGHSLGTRINVEGVETREQLDFLLGHGVDEAQGFYFSRAVPAADFARLVREKSPYALTVEAVGA